VKERRLVSHLPDSDPTRDDLPRYDRDGYCTLPLLDPDLVAALLHDADRLADHASGMTRSQGHFDLETSDGGYPGQDRRVPAPRGRGARGPSLKLASGGTCASPFGPRRVVPSAGALRKVSNVVEHSPAAALAAAHPDVLAAARDAVGAAWVDLAHSILWCKPPSVGSAKPFHQDAAYLDGDLDRYVTVWIALDPATSLNGCLRLVPGSHRVDVDHIGSESQINGPEWSAAVVDLPLEPGAAIVFHPRLIHASGPNHSQEPRRALMLRYLSPARSDVEPR
jgi:hypothetical protein